MDVHLTHSSSTVLEAEAFGLPSIIFSEHGAELYPEQVSSGSAVVACTALEILNAMESLEGGNRGRRGPEENSKGVEKQALKFLTDIIQARRRNDQVARQA
jgi:hypothetical protein